jgi:chemotaxis protein MotB
MESRGIRRSRNEEEEESYFISMADMMVGLLFIFIILLLYFALQMKEKTAELTGATATRTMILRKLETSLKDQGIKVSVDEKAGILRLPEDVLFASGADQLSEKGYVSVAIVARELASVLPCYTYPRPERGCENSKHSIDAIFVEGHTDSDRMGGRGIIEDNLDLSMKRATNTYRRLTEVEQRLMLMRNAPGDQGQPVLSVSGYGELRPIALGDSPEAKQKNRRIDLRFLMVAPQSDEVKVIGAKAGLR